MKKSFNFLSLSLLVGLVFLAPIAILPAKHILGTYPITPPVTPPNTPTPTLPITPPITNTPTPTPTVTDPYEPDNTYAEAKWIPLGTNTEIYRFNYSQDRDWKRFMAEANRVYKIETVKIGSQSFPAVDVYGQNGTPMLVYGITVPFYWRAPASGVYYLRARNQQNFFGQETDYTMKIAQIPVPTPTPTPVVNQYEPDNTYTEAKWLPLGSNTEVYRFDFSQDKDWKKFTAEANRVYKIETVKIGSQSFPTVDVYDRNGTKMLVYGITVPFYWRAPASGIYYLRARNLQNFFFGPGTDYSLKITPL